MKSIVLGAGVVGSAATWDLVRRGHDVAVVDADASATEAASLAFGVEATTFDVRDTDKLVSLLAPYDAVVSAVPYRFGLAIAEAAIRSGTHYVDFGGNPTVVGAQKELSSQALAAGLMVVPDCGLAPGLANVMATQMIADTGSTPIESVQIRVGALPQTPTGALGYQIAFSTAGLINEYVEPCEVIEDGTYATVEPLTRFETVEWDRWGPLEAFSTAGGTSTMCAVHLGAVTNLEYKTLRFPGHGKVFRALLEVGMFEENPGGADVSPRDLLRAALDRSLPKGAPDLVLARVTVTGEDGIRVMQFEDQGRDGYTALARTTAFPATALVDLILRDRINRPGVKTMNEAVTGDELLPELESVGIHITTQ